jgi:hypothetical protein
MAAQASGVTRPTCSVAELMLKVILAGTIGHYENGGMVDDKRLEQMLEAGKQILYKTHKESNVRYDSSTCWSLRNTSMTPTAMMPLY